MEEINANSNPKDDKFQTEEVGEKSKKSKFAQFFLKELSPRTKKILAVFLIIFGGLFAFGIYILPFDTGNNTTLKEKEKPKLDTACPLTGVYVQKPDAQRRPFGVMIENHYAARPQSGLDKADLVYEVVTEGEITRFLAFYQCQKADEIGPVRSSRIYYLDWVAELSAFYAHAGGSPDALAQISRDGALDLQHATGYFWRSSSRPAPHNLYTSINKLEQYASSKKYDLNQVDFTSWDFKDDPTKAKRPAEFNFKIHFSSASYLVEYIYNQATNDWTRKIAGQIQKDAKNGESINVKNIAVEFTQITKRSDGRVNVGTIGSGRALFFIDGKVTEGTWKKDSAGERVIFLDSKGNKIKFSRGSTWVEVVQDGTKVEY